MDLSESAIHLWFAFLADWKDRAADASAYDLLDSGELARMERLRSRENRRLFGISHWLVRTALAQYADHSPAAWRFTTNEHGKPRIDPASGHSPLVFSLAHTKGLAVVAVTKEGDVGVDVERTDRRVNARQMIRRFFAPAEVQALENLSTQALADRFFLHWTLKEAGLKALGVGLSRPLSDFSFCLSEERPRRIAPSGVLLPGRGQWRWAAFAPQPLYVVALGIAGTAGKPSLVRCYRATAAGQAEPFACTPIALSANIVCESPALYR